MALWKRLVCLALALAGARPDPSFFVLACKSPSWTVMDRPCRNQLRHMVRLCELDDKVTS